MRLAVLTFACAAVVVVAPARAQDSADALRQEIRTLRQTLEAMEKRLDALESVPPTATPAPPTRFPLGTTFHSELPNGKLAHLIERRFDREGAGAESMRCHRG